MPQSQCQEQQLELEDLRVISLKSIRNLNLPATLAVSYISLALEVHKDNIFLTELKEYFKLHTSKSQIP